MDLEILEGLALSEDRPAALAKLLPGSEDHDYYRVLHAQHRGDLAEAERILDAWAERHGDSPRRDRLRLRQQIHRTVTTGAGADELRDALGVSHWHEAEVEAEAAARPTRLPDPAVDPADLLREALERDASLGLVSDEGLLALLGHELDPSRRRALLGRLGHTARPEVVGLVAAELAERASGGFGALRIHGELTLAQLHALAGLVPALTSHTGWVAAVVARMRPPARVDLALDLDARAAHLAALWAFVAPLPPANDALEDHVLWHLLDTARRRGAALDPALVEAYLALPRSASYRAPGWDRDDEVAHGADFPDSGLPPAGSDEELIRAAIEADPDGAERFAPWLDRAWLDAEVAAARLLAGAADERATLVLGPARAAALRDRVELTWCLHNPTRFAADAPVALEADVKHVAELVLKVYRIDPVAYFQIHHQEVDVTLDLDGLAATAEQTLRFSEPAIRRVRRRFELAACARPGTYVIDLIGNGMASRAVIHKGRLRHVARTTAAGEVVTILDEAGRPRPDARAWIGEREYLPDERGELVVPFSPRPGRVAMLLVAGDVTTVDQLAVRAEHAQLQLDVLLDRQELSAGRTATAIARLGLAIGGGPASLARLRDATWDVTLTDRRGVATTRSQPLALDDSAAAELAIPLGDDTARIALAVRATLDLPSEQRELAVSASRDADVATLYGGPATAALYLAHTAAGWVISALGKTGEPRAHHPVTIGIVHRFTSLQRNAELATDAHGRIELGPLPGVARITATLGDLTQRFELDDPPPLAPRLHALAGRDLIVHLPASRTAGEVARHASLVELRAGHPAHHPACELFAMAGAIAVRGLGPGDYQLRAPGLQPIALVVAHGVERAGWAVEDHRLVELPRPAPAIAALTVGDALVVEVAGAGADTRVHVIATRFAAAPIAPVADGPRRAAAVRTDAEPAARYVSGRELGDEARYVLERRARPRYPGLLVERPSLLLNPWARRATTTDVAHARPGGSFAPAPAPMRAQMLGGAPLREISVPTGDGFAGYDFLAAPPVVLANLALGDGRVEIPRAALGDATLVTVIVDDPAGLTTRRATLPEPPLAARDLRLLRALEPDRHVRQHKAIAPLAAGDRLEIADLATAQVHLVDSVERAHAYLLGLRDDPALRELAFVTHWHALPDAERRALYSQHACHELHLFLFHKDPAFFAAVIRPYLVSKRTPTFVDHYLLGADLAPYLEPARLQELNAVERALLAQRLRGEPALVRLLDDPLAITPPDPARDARLIDALLGAATLDGDPALEAAFDAAEARAFDATPAFGAALAKADAAEAPKLKKAGRARRAEELDRRAEPPVFRPADRTQEWAEHNWWHRTPADSGPSMIPVNRLWRDLAHHAGGPFLSPWLGLATGSFAEAMCALAVTDLPFVAAGHAITADGPRLTVAAAGPALAGTSQLVDGALAPAGAPLVVGMSYVRADDRHAYVDGEQVDKYVDGPLVTGVVYSCLVVLANPSSSRQRVQALLQIPRGSLPVSGARPTETIDVLLEPYGTHGHEYAFYFPAAGRWTHFPVHVSRAGQLVAAAPGRTLEVIAGAAATDPGSWAHVAQRGTVAEVAAFVARGNLAAIDLTAIAWRLRERAAYDAILGALEARRWFDDTLWGYALYHGDRPRIVVWLRARGAALLAAGPALDVIGLDAEAVGGYEHLEYAPLVNARAHRLGPARRILNAGLAAQYERFLELVAHRAAPTPEDLLAAVHYLLAQDRIAPALAALARVDAAQVRDQLQLAYVQGYAACLTGDLATARDRAAAGRDHPVDRWRHRFAALAAMLDELAGAAPVAIDPRSRDQRHAELAARQPAFELAADAAGVIVRSQHVAALELRFFEMDVELLFSRQPFVQSDVSRFSFIEPGHRELLREPGGEQRVGWPADLAGKHVVVEAVAAGARKAVAHYANDLALQLAHQYGQLRIRRASTGEPLAATYVKVYARRAGEVVFYKDGYSDLRGWFDYATLSTDELDRVERFAILVVADHAGAAILEAAPPGPRSR
jgi:hypothetical protein